MSLFLQENCRTQAPGRTVVSGEPTPRAEAPDLPGQAPDLPGQVPNYPDPDGQASARPLVDAIDIDVSVRNIFIIVLYYISVLNQG